MWPYVLTVDSMWARICVLRYLVATLLAALLGSLTWVWPGKDYWLHPPRRFKTAEETWTIGTTCSRSMSLGISILASASTSVFRMLEAYRHGSTVWRCPFSGHWEYQLLSWCESGEGERRGLWVPHQAVIEHKTSRSIRSVLHFFSHERKWAESKTQILEVIDIDIIYNI